MGHLITDDIKDNPTMNDLIGEVKAYLNIAESVSDIQNICSKFLKAFVAVGGSYGGVANVLHKELTETGSKELNFNLKIDLNWFLLL